MTAKFARFVILETVPLHEYARRLRLAGRHRKRFDDLELRRCLIDDNRAYLLDENDVVIEHNEITAHTLEEKTAAPIDEAHEASIDQPAMTPSGWRPIEQMKVSTPALILFGLACISLTHFLMDGVSLGLPRWLYLVGAVAFVVAAEVFSSQEGMPTMTKLEMFADVFIVSLLFVGLIVAIIWLLLRVVG